MGPLATAAVRGHDRSVPTPHAELSSVVSALDDMVRRVAAMADQAAAEHEDDTATELFAVERALTGARRRLSRVVAPSKRR